MRNPLLGGLATRTFLSRHWQKQALLVRQAIPHFGGVLDFRELMGLACSDTVESRLVVRDARRWTLRHGPFDRTDFRRLPARNWTLLVQGVNLHDDRAAALLARFAFLPHARLDDLMVSYAVPGGGVGPHFDAYDVFLLQGEGKRRWRIGRQNDLALVPGAPLKILRRFQPEGEAILLGGDMLYLPPRFAHHGVAVTECTTWSIGYRAPTHQELASRFLSDLAERLVLPGQYADPDLAATVHPGRIGGALVATTERLLAGIRWRRRDVTDFLGRHLTEPKPQVFFDPPPTRHGSTGIVARIRRQGAKLDRRSLMLYADHAVYLNGEEYRFPRGVPAPLRELADRRCLAPQAVPAPIATVLYDWWAAGFIRLPAAGS